jgi:hypothetical protein
MSPFAELGLSPPLLTADERGSDIPVDRALMKR